MDKDFSRQTWRFSAAIHIVHAPIKGSCTIILHRRSMRLLQNPDGLQGKATQYGGKKTGQTVFNGCKYRF